MSDLTDKISYLKGMASGMKLNMEKDSNKLIVEILSAMGDLAKAVEANRNSISDLNDKTDDIMDSIDDLGEELEELEDDFYDDDYDYSEDDEDDSDFSDDEDENDGFIEYQCPNCGHMIEFKASEIDFEDENLCPECGKPIFPEIADSEEEEEEEETEETEADSADGEAPEAEYEIKPEDFIKKMLENSPFSTMG